MGSPWDFPSFFRSISAFRQPRLRTNNLLASYTQVWHSVNFDLGPLVLQEYVYELHLVRINFIHPLGTL